MEVHIANTSAFVYAAPYALRSQCVPVTKFASHRVNAKRTKRFYPRACEQDPYAHILPSAEAAINAWKERRNVATRGDLTRRFVSVLFVSNNCHRAIMAEKILALRAEQLSISRRLLILSAGIEAKPGDVLPRSLLLVAARYAINISENQPCAAFDIFDLEHYDFVLAMDRQIRDKLLLKAEAAARHTGAHLYEWERKIRLVADFDGSRGTARRSAGTPIDIPKFSVHSDPSIAIDAIQEACDRALRLLIACGL